MVSSINEVHIRIKPLFYTSVFLKWYTDYSGEMHTVISNRETSASLST